MVFLYCNPERGTIPTHSVNIYTINLKQFFNDFDLVSFYRQVKGGVTLFVCFIDIQFRVLKQLSKFC